MNRQIEEAEDHIKDCYALLNEREAQIAVMKSYLKDAGEALLRSPFPDDGALGKEILRKLGPDTNA